jgi:imidazolonepropionase
MPTIKTADLLILNASELVTMAGRRRPRQREDMANVHAVADGAVAIREGRILACGRTPDITARFVQRNGKPLDARGKTVIPGFVDPHTHLVFAGSRESELVMKLEGKSYMEILASGGGIQRTVRATRAASDRELLSGTLGRLDRMLLHGTTTVEGKSGYGLDLDTEMRSLIALEMAGMRHPVDVVRTFLGAHVVPPEYKGRPDDYIDFLIRTALPEVVRLKLAEFCDVFCEQDVFTVAQSRRLLLAARKLGLRLKVHADEIVRTRGAELAAEVGAISADHLLRSSKEGLERMKEAGVIGVLLPGTPFSLMQKEYPDARMMVSMGLPVALATDLNPNCLTESMPFIIALACYKLKLTPSEALTAATINAACAIGRENEVGSLEPGKKADVAVLDAPNHLHIPYHFGVNLVETVIKDGQVVVKNGARVAKV